jgi:CheY-like chemotaxis protein
MKSLNLLVAEDNKSQQVLMRALLEKLGHSVEVVENGGDALDRRFKGGGYDLILMDVSMPVMDGAEAADAIRRGEEALNLPHMPIIAVTAHVIEGGLEYFMGYGMNGYVIKPVQVDLLVAEIERVLAIPSEDL